MTQDPEAIRQEIAETRARMGQTVEALGSRADIGSQARGSIRGLSFAYCTFTKRNPRTNLARAASAPLPLRASATVATGAN